MSDTPSGRELHKHDCPFCECGESQLPAPAQPSAGPLDADWRKCPKCGVDWPHPRVTSYLECSPCRIAAAVEAERRRPRSLDLGAFQERISTTAASKGWAPDYSVDAVKRMSAEEISALLIRLRKQEMLGLIHTEVTEAFEAIRHREPVSDHIKEFSLMEEELADVVIRVLHTAKLFGYRVIEAMLAKADFNDGREYKHGGKEC